MVRFAARRVGRNVVVVLLVTMAAVALLSLASGSAGAVILGENATPEAVAALNARLGLDRPLWQQYLTWLGHAVGGDLGTSPVTNEPVIDAVIARLPVTLELAVLALLISVVSAVVLAVVSATWQDTAVDRVITALSSVLLSVPAFIAGPLLGYFLALQLGAAFHRIAPRHRYAPALLGAAPTIDHERHTRLRLITGSLPDPVAPPQGCRFAPRCDAATAGCTDPGPVMTSVGSDHDVVCCHPVAVPAHAGGDLVGR